MTETDENGERGGLSDGERNIPKEELLTGSRRIEGSIRWKWGLGALFVAAVAGIVVGAISVIVLEWGPLPGVGAVALVAILGVGHVLLLYRSWQYEVRKDALSLERGVITHVKTVVPFVRVQHIDTSRGPIDRLLGLSSLVVYTAGSRGADVTIPGLTPEDAEDLQERLKLLAKESTGDDAV
ncbi:PH domain-containing protein [Halorhabdus amylolytica]|uniref:PH domain-containing protein n=1 Tax=Halorhabdus amylolytica TaxID=2559573 RepID=UPI001B7D832E